MKITNIILLFNTMTSFVVIRQEGIIEVLHLIDFSAS